MADVLAAPYVEAARARGLSRRTVLGGYVLGPALRPVLAYLGPLAAGVLAGSLVVERLFGLPGMGGYLVDGALARDYPLVLGATLVYLLLLLATNLAVELLVGALDPRLRRRWTVA
jgi:oligopeptide transport system permease protein